MAIKSLFFILLKAKRWDVSPCFIYIYCSLLLLKMSNKVFFQNDFDCISLNDYGKKFERGIIIALFRVMYHNRHIIVNRLHCKNDSSDLELVVGTLSSFFILVMLQV